MNVPFWWKQTAEHASRTQAGSRIVAQIEYLASLEKIDAKLRTEALVPAMETIHNSVARNGVVHADTLRRLEEELQPFRGAARSVTLHFVGHAHLDMNWMWGYDETTIIVLETMRTVLRLLEEYPDFRFSQSQGAIYRIIEQYEPELLSPIREYVQAGRWELSATQWTETDMNLPDAESLVRHALETIPYLQELLGVGRERLRLAFMPDTFGHSAATPEILAEAGVEWVYHCRGFTGPILSRWKAPSGRSVLAYREPRWYNERVEPSLLRAAALTAKEAGIDDVLAVYGVGDHGGGPTIRDIELILKMRSWPFAPHICFSTYHEFFRTLEPAIDLPVVTGERNRIFTGCYSSQARIKSGNRSSARLLSVAETIGVVAGTLMPARLRDSWRTLLFNQFHDILPGSGVPATRAYALAGYQSIGAAAQTELNRAMRELASRVQPGAARLVDQIQAELEMPVEPARDRPGSNESDTAEGAGVGYTVGAARASGTGRWGGVVRPYLVMNPLEKPRTLPVEIVVWDYPDVAVEVVDESGIYLASQTLKRGQDLYWGHDYTVILVEMRLEPWEYRTVFVRPAADAPLDRVHHPYGVDNWLVDHTPALKLENEHLAVTMDPEALSIVSLVDRSTGIDLLGCAGARFELEFEERAHMSAWYTHRKRASHPVGAGGSVKQVVNGGDSLRKWIEIEAPFSGRGLSPGQGGSSLRLRVELDRGSSLVRLIARVVFREVASDDLGVPRLVFRATTSFAVASAVRDIPVGLVESEIDGAPHAAQSGMVVRGDGLSLSMIGRDSQSFSSEDHAVVATLLRGSDNPDPAPEVAEHNFLLLLGKHDLAHDHGAREQLVEPQVISVPRPPGEAVDRLVLRGGVDEDDAAQPLRYTPLEIEVTRARVLALKPPAIGSVGGERQAVLPRAKGVVLRLAADTNQSGIARLVFAETPVAVELVDGTEETVLGVEGNTPLPSLSGREVRVEVPARRVVTIRVDLP